MHILSQHLWSGITAIIQPGRNMAHICPDAAEMGSSLSSMPQAELHSDMEIPMLS